MDDAALVGFALADPQQGVAGIYERYGTSLYNYCYSLLRSESDAGDALQDSFITVIAKLDQLRDPTKLRPWLYAIARNECFKRHRHRDRERPDDMFEQDNVVVAETPTDAGELVALVWQASDGLSEVDRSVLELNIRHELDGEDLAASLGVTGSKCSVMLHRAKARLQAAVGALIVSRTGVQACPELAGMVKGHDFSPLVRKRVARHIKQCEVCEETERTHRPETYLALVPVLPIPAVLDQSVLTAIQAGSFSSWSNQGQTAGPDAAGTATGHDAAAPLTGTQPEIAHPPVTNSSSVAAGDTVWDAAGFPRLPGSTSRRLSPAIGAGIGVCIVLVIVALLSLLNPFGRETTVLAGPGPEPTSLAARPQFVPTVPGQPPAAGPSLVPLPTPSPAPDRLAPPIEPSSTPTGQPVTAPPPPPAPTTVTTAAVTPSPTAMPTPTATPSPTTTPPPTPTTSPPEPGTPFPGPVAPPSGPVFLDFIAPTVASFTVGCGDPFLVTVAVFDAVDSSPTTSLVVTWDNEADPAVPLTSIGSNTYRASVPRSELDDERIDFFVRGTITDNSANQRMVDITDDCFIAQ